MILQRHILVLLASVIGEWFLSAEEDEEIV